MFSKRSHISYKKDTAKIKDNTILVKNINTLVTIHNIIFSYNPLLQSHLCDNKVWRILELKLEQIRLIFVTHYGSNLCSIYKKSEE